MVAENGVPADGELVLDRLERPLRDLRISVTDRCQMRCSYCMPSTIFGPDHAFLPRSDILTYEEMDAVVAALVPQGLAKVRLTGGEPLLRRDLDRLVAMLASRGVEVALTTNGLLLERRAAELAAAGLDRVTVSLDALDPIVFEAITETPGKRVQDVLAGIGAALEAGLEPVKVNAVIRRGSNESEMVRLVDRFHGTGVQVRFIEYMDVGNSNGWRLDDVVTVTEMRAVLAAAGHRLEAMEPAYRGEVAKRWRHVDGGGEVGFIGSISQPFCGDCSRARLAADGHLYTCLFATQGVDLRPLLRPDGAPMPSDALPIGASLEERRLPVGIIEAVGERMESIWRAREDRYSEARGEATEASGVGIALPRIEMSYIGG